MCIKLFSFKHDVDSKTGLFCLNRIQLLTIIGRWRKSSELIHFNVLAHYFETPVVLYKCFSVTTGIPYLFLWVVTPTDTQSVN